MLCSLQRWGGLAVVGAAVLLGACSNGTGTHVGKADRRSSTVAAAAGRSARPYVLYTHCGIDEARIDNHYYEAVHPLNDGSGNPPTGWGNPYQQGTITLVSPAEALFRDNAGHHVLFRLRTGATSFRHVCS
jgi:hypothetical protein